MRTEITTIDGWMINRFSHPGSCFNDKFYAARKCGKTWSGILGDYLDAFAYIHPDGSEHSSTQVDDVYSGYFESQQDVEAAIQKWRENLEKACGVVTPSTDT